MHSSTATFIYYYNAFNLFLAVGSDNFSLGKICMCFYIYTFGQDIALRHYNRGGQNMVCTCRTILPSTRVGQGQGTHQVQGQLRPWWMPGQAAELGQWCCQTPVSGSPGSDGFLWLLLLLVPVLLPEHPSLSILHSPPAV